MTPIVLILLGFLGGALAPTITVLAERKRTGSETTENEATAADVLSQGAVRLVPYYESRIADLDHRLTIAEAATLVAQQTATGAREAESRCLARLDAMQAQIDAMQARQDHPPTTTTVTTAVTTHDPIQGETPA